MPAKWKLGKQVVWLLPLLLLAAGAGMSGLPYLSAGHPTSIDVWPHLARQATVYQALKTHASPFWSFAFYCGYPMLRFYAPLFALLGGLLALVFNGDQVATLKTLLFVLHVASCLTMFIFLNRRTRSVPAASLGALVYLLVPWRTVHLGILANYPQALVYLLLPFVFLGFDEVRQRPSLRTSALFALGLGLLFVSHQFYSLFTCVLLLPAVLLGLRRERGGPTPLRRIAFLKLGGIGALLVAGFFLIPFLFEFRARLYPLARITMPAPDLSVLLSRVAEPGGYEGSYLGLSCVVLALASAVVGLLGRARRRVFPAVIGLALSLAFVFGTELLGPAGNVVTFGLPGMRFLLFVVFFFGLLTAEGVAWLEERLPRMNLLRTTLVAGCAVLLAVDCLPPMRILRYSVDMHFLRTRDEIYRAMRSQRPTRVLDLYTHEDRADDPRRLDCFPAIGFLYGGLATPFGPHYDQFAPKSMLYVYPWANFIATELGDSTRPELPRAALDALALMGISQLITVPTPMKQEGEMMLVTVKPPLDWDKRFVEEDRDPPLAVGWTGMPLALASTTLMPVSGTDPVPERSLIVAGDWRDLLDAVVAGAGANSINLIPVADGDGPRSLPGPASLQVEYQDIRSDRLHVRLRAAGDCFVRLAVSYYPELRVELDGRPARFAETADHFVWLECPAGRHSITVTAPLGVLRTVCSVLSLLAVLACVAALVLPRRRPTAR